MEKFGNEDVTIEDMLVAVDKIYSKEEQDEFYRQATASDYNHLLITCLEWFNVE